MAGIVNKVYYQGVHPRHFHTKVPRGYLITRTIKRKHWSPLIPSTILCSIAFQSYNSVITCVASVSARVYSQLSLRRTPLGPVLCVRLRQKSVLKRVK